MSNYMSLTDYKIPIITGRNDQPTTSETNPNHPNGSFITAKYNDLIDELIDTSPTTTDDLTEGTTNLYHTTARVRQAISVTGNATYDNATGVINVTGGSSTPTSIHHISLTNTDGLTKTYTIWGDADETIDLGSFDVTDGASGADGRGISGITYNETNGRITITFSDDTTWESLDIRGADGVSPTVMVLSQGDYDAISTYAPNIFYVINA